MIGLTGWIGVGKKVIIMNKWMDVSEVSYLTSKDKLPPLNTKILAYYYEPSGTSDKPLIEGEEIGELIAKDSESGWPVWAFKTGILGGGEVKKWKHLQKDNNELSK